VVGARYRLESLLRPDLDPGAYCGVDVGTQRAVLVCLVDREIGAAAEARRVSHPALVPVLAAGVARDAIVPPLDPAVRHADAYVVLEPFEGETLGELIQRVGPLPAPFAVALALAVAEGLGALHAAGGVHAGVSPLAIDVLDVEGAQARLGRAGSQDTAIAYQSPYRLSGGGPSTHDDAWALLGCLYLAVTGASPFEAESPRALARRVLGGRPLPIRVVSDADRHLQTIFTRGFTRTASAHHPDADSLAAELRGWLAAHAPELVRPEPVPAAPAPEIAEPIAEPEVSIAELEVPSAELEALAVEAPVEQAPLEPRAAEPPEVSEPSAERTDSCSAEPVSTSPAERPSALAEPAPRAPIPRTWIAVGVLAAAAGSLLVLLARPAASRRDLPAQAAVTAAPSAVAPSALPPARATAIVAPPSAAPLEPRAADLDACVAAWFPEATFDPDSSFAFLCAEPDGRRISGGLHRAIVAGGKGQRITEAMREWTTFGWFELPVLATLRASCCPRAAPLQMPRVLGSTCPPPDEALAALATAAAGEGDVDAAIRAYRKSVACVVEHGEAVAYGQRAPIGGAEEPAFRALLGRGRRR
jgi:hypothetical protein